MENFGSEQPKAHAGYYDGGDAQAANQEKGIAELEIKMEELSEVIKTTRASGRAGGAVQEDYTLYPPEGSRWAGKNLPQLEKELLNLRQQRDALRGDRSN